MTWRWCRRLDHTKQNNKWGRSLPRQLEINSLYVMVRKYALMIHTKLTCDMFESTFLEQKLKFLIGRLKGIISKKSLKNPLHLFIRHLFHLFIWESISRLAFFKFYSTSVSKFMVIFITYLHIYIPHIFCSFMHFVHRYGLSIRQLKYVCREILLNTQQMKLQNKAI